MVTVNTADKYTDLYTLYKKSMQETKALEYCLTQVGYNLEQKDLEKLSSVLTKYDLDRLRKRVESRNTPDLPWLA